jgi:hypothetical protein
MKPTTIIYALLTALLFTTCHKQNETILDFTFTDQNSGKPVEGLEIYLQEFDQNKNSGLITNKVTLASYKTDAHGKLYQVLKHLNTKKEHGIEWQKPSECYEKSNGPYGVKVGQVTKYERALETKGVTMLYIKNVTPFNENDTMYECRSYTREINPYCFLPNTAYVGMDINQIRKIDYGGNKKIYFHWKVIKNGVTKMYFDSFTTVICDTTKFYINY